MKKLITVHRNVFLLSAILIITILISACSIIQFKYDTVQEKQGVTPNKNIRGTLNMALAWGQRLSPPRQYSRVIINLKDAMTKWTDVTTILDDHLMLDSPKLHKMPFVLVTTDKAFELTSTERGNIKKYLTNGGFMVLDNPEANADRSQAESSLRKMLRDVLGAGSRLEPISISHEIYHCYFDFTDGPPIGSENRKRVVRRDVDVEIGPDGKPTEKVSEIIKLPKQVRYLEGIFIGDRLAVVFSNKGYGVNWNDRSNNEAQLKMGVNLMVFALTQPGGIASEE